MRAFAEKCDSGGAAPQVMLEANKQQIEAKRNMAQEVRDLAQAIMYMSQADKNVGDAHLDWLSHQLDVYRAIFEAQKPIPGPKGPDGAQSAPIKPKAPPLPAAINPEQPHPEAKQAPDGNWYVPDKGRPGRYLQVLKREMNIDATGDQTTPGA